jgi:hypothetical protein
MGRERWKDGREGGREEGGRRDETMIDCASEIKEGETRGGRERGREGGREGGRGRSKQIM